MAGQSAEVRCRTCGYDLRGLTETRCPECGGKFDPADPDTYLSRGRGGFMPLAFSLLGVILVLGGFADEVWPDVPVVASPVFLSVSFFSGIAMSVLTVRHCASVLLCRVPWVERRWAVIIALIVSSSVPMWFVTMIGLLVYHASR